MEKNGKILIIIKVHYIKFNKLIIFLNRLAIHNKIIQEFWMKHLTVK